MNTSVTGWFVMLGLLPLGLQAGQVYGSVSSGGKPVAAAPIEIDCSGTPTSGATSSDGSFRVTVTGQGKCTFTLSGYAGKPSALVFSNAKPTLYDFELTKMPNGNYELRIR